MHLTLFIKCLLVFIIVCLIQVKCGRSGGSRRGGGGSPPRYTTRRPYSTARTTYRSYSSTYRTTSRSLTTRRSQYSSTPNYNSNNVGYNIPPKPGSTYSTGSSPQKIKIVNKYNYHYPGYYSMPVQSQFPGYYHSGSSYHYGMGDTGSTVLGVFLGYSLAKMTTPTFSHQSFYDGYRPRYDHYEVHHYYHNKDSVPKNQDIPSNTIVGCVGDSTSVCPANTTSLCTSNGALMCVVSATSTVPCTDNRQVNCIKSTISCVNNTAPECKNQNSTTISIPCISNANVQGNLQFVNNTIIATNTTTTTTQNPITTMPPAIAQNFCVTILALPAKKEETQGEQVLKDAKSVFDNFIDSIFKI